MKKSTLYTDADLSQDHVAISFANGPATDAFGRLRVSAPATSLLDAAGAVRSLGTLSVIVTGLGGTSACRCNLTWEEVR